MATRSAAAVLAGALLWLYACGADVQVFGRATDDDDGSGGAGSGGDSGFGGFGSVVTVGSTALSSSSLASSSSGGRDCAHDPCATGDALAEGCDPCVDAVCAEDGYCCTGVW